MSVEDVPGTRRGGWPTKQPDIEEREKVEEEAQKNFRSTALMTGKPAVRTEKSENDDFTEHWSSK